MKRLLLIFYFTPQSQDKPTVSFPWDISHTLWKQREFGLSFKYWVSLKGVYEWLCSEIPPSCFQFQDRTKGIKQRKPGFSLSFSEFRALEVYLHWGLVAWSFTIPLKPCCHTLDWSNRKVLTLEEVWSHSQLVAPHTKAAHIRSVLPSLKDSIAFPYCQHCEFNGKRGKKKAKKQQPTIEPTNNKNRLDVWIES